MLITLCVLGAAVVAPRLYAQPRAPRTGTITGHVTLAGTPPGNPVIRMGMDPKCADMNRGRMVIQEEALVARDGSVGNVFVRLEGTFPQPPVPSAPVVIDQRACVYGPRVVGVRVVRDELAIGSEGGRPERGGHLREPDRRQRRGVVRKR